MACTVVYTGEHHDSETYQWETHDDLIEAIFKLAHKPIDIFIAPTNNPEKFPDAKYGYIGTMAHTKEVPNV